MSERRRGTATQFVYRRNAANENEIVCAACGLFVAPAGKDVDFQALASTHQCSEGPDHSKVKNPRIKMKKEKKPVALDGILDRYGLEQKKAKTLKQPTPAPKAEPS
jgi:hypothetical protein